MKSITGFLFSLFIASIFIGCGGGGGGSGITTTTTQTQTITAASSISVGSAHACALTTSGGVKCWGLNGRGSLGNGTITGPQTCDVNSCSTTPIDVTGLSSNITAIAAGAYHTCALTTSGGVKCWGENNYGQLGDGTSTGPQICSDQPCSPVPVDVVGFGG